jgi:hypothetical protein
MRLYAVIAVTSDGRELDRGHLRVLDACDIRRGPPTNGTRSLGSRGEDGLGPQEFVRHDGPEIDECADPLPPPSTVLECLVDIVLEGLDRPRVAENAPTSLTAAIVVALAAAGSVSAGIASKGTSTKRSLRQSARSRYSVNRQRASRSRISRSRSITARRCSRNALSFRKSRFPPAISTPRMEHLWSQAGATSGNRWQMRQARNGSNKPIRNPRQPTATVQDRMPTTVGRL